MFDIKLSDWLECALTYWLIFSVCVQDDLSEPLYEEDLDGSAGVLFPFYDADTHMLYLAGKVLDANI